MRKSFILLFLISACAFAQSHTLNFEVGFPGTSQNKLVKLDSYGYAVETLAGDKIAIGIADTTSKAVSIVTVTTEGVHNCIFDNAANANDMFENSPSVNGDCHALSRADLKGFEGVILGCVLASTQKTQTAPVEIWGLGCHSAHPQIISPKIGNHVRSITPDQGQPHGAAPATSLLYLNTTPQSLVGTAFPQVVLNSSPIGPLAAGQGIEISVQAQRTAGKGSQTWEILFTRASSSLANCTYTNLNTTDPVTFHIRVKNVARSTAEQIVGADPVFIGSTMVCGSYSFGAWPVVNWGIPQTVTVRWVGTDPADRVTFYQMAIYANN